MLEKMKSRKFLFVCYLLTLAPVMCWCQKITGQELVAVWMLVSGTYIIGQSLIDAKKADE
jgi:hypothetical protein